jgi:putative copper resistance protein D
VNEAYTLLDAAAAAARWGWLASVFLLLGAGSYAPFLFQSRTHLEATDPDIAEALPRRAAGIGFIAGLALMALTALRLYLQARSLQEPGEPVTAELLGAVLDTDWGTGWKRQAVLTVLAVLAFGAAKAGSRFGWMVASAAGGGLGLAAGMTGHAVTNRAGPMGLILDAAHVWAGGLWLGGLAVLLIAGLGACRRLASARRPIVVRALVADFSRRALIFGPITIGFGVWMAVHYLGWRWPLDLFKSSYGWTLAVKLGVLLVIACLGAYNWRVAQPALGDSAGERRFRGSAVLELVFGGLLLAVTAVLVALPFPGEH